MGVTLMGFSRMYGAHNVSIVLTVDRHSNHRPIVVTIHETACAQKKRHQIKKNQFFQQFHQLLSIFRYISFESIPPRLIDEKKYEWKFSLWNISKKHDETRNAQSISRDFKYCIYFHVAITFKEKHGEELWKNPPNNVKNTPNVAGKPPFQMIARYFSRDGNREIVVCSYRVVMI